MAACEAHSDATAWPRSRMSAKARVAMRRTRPWRRYSGNVPTAETPPIGTAVPLARIVNGIVEKLDTRRGPSKAHRVHSGRVVAVIVFSGPSPWLPP